MAGSFAILSSITDFAGTSEISGVASTAAGVGSGIATIGAGVQNLLSDATEAANAVLQHGKVSHQISYNAGWFIQKYRESLENYATRLLEAPADDKNLTQYLDIFKDGKFADQVDKKYAENFRDLIRNTVYSSSLAAIWRQNTRKSTG
ncbi:hypothetical protein N7492_001434 [Penicillium capsulatum]|uniref:Uncharacterized protein n=1 Tax=Penicillium capsulatum TaxID=69766 RepID=A0A9W9LZQ3_9EURO|nr:hypothetical protein N7492_001434 [Penicillium capsulatum]